MDDRCDPVCTQWECFVAGPSDTPYEGGLFRAILTFPPDYPLSPVRAGGWGFPALCFVLSRPDAGPCIRSPR